MAKGAPPPFMKKGGKPGKPNPFAGKKAPPFGGGKPAPMGDMPAFKKGGKVGR